MIRGPDFSKDIPAGVVRTIMHKADLDESGYLEYPEFIAMVSQRSFDSIFKDIGNYICFYLSIFPRNIKWLEMININSINKKGHKTKRVII